MQKVQQRGVLTVALYKDFAPFSDEGQGIDVELAQALAAKLGVAIGPDAPLAALWKLTISQTAPVLPYLLMVLMLIFRPRGIMGTREG